MSSFGSSLSVAVLGLSPGAAAAFFRQTEGG